MTMTLTTQPTCAIRRVTIAPATHQAGDVITGYLALWGTQRVADCYGTWFDHNKPPNMGLEYAPFPLWYEHGFDPQVGKTTIGEITRTWADDVGIGFEAVLYRNTPHYAKIRAEIDRGELGVSSSSADHVADFDEQKRFVTWLLTEISLTAEPCETRMPAVQFTRSQQGYQARFESNVSTQDGVAPRQCMVGRNMEKATCGCSQSHTHLQRRTLAMTLQELIAQGVTDPMQLFSALVAELGGVEAAMQALQQMNTQPAPEAPEVSSAPPVPRSSVTPEQLAVVAAALRGTPAPTSGNNGNDIAALRSQLEGLTTQLRSMAADRSPAPSNQPAPRNDAATRQANRPGQPNITGVQDLRYAHLRHRDMMFVQMALVGNKQQVSPEFRRAMAFKAASALEKGDSVMNTPEVRSAFPFTRANEVMQSDLAAGGDEWVGIAYGTDIWEKARVATIWQEMKARGLMEIEIPQGAESFYVPLEGNDPTFYSLEQSRDADAVGRPSVIVSASKASTGRVLVNAGFVGAAVYWNGILDEDSLIPMATQLSAQMDAAAEENIESLILNGDTATGASTNINLIDGTPTSTGTARPLYLATDGILKLPLVTNTAKSRDGGAFDHLDFLQTFKLLPQSLRANKKGLMFVMDGDTAVAAVAIPAFLTRDVNSQATIESGVLMNAFGVDTFESGQMALANNAGKIPAAGGTLGRLLIIAPRYWALGWKRKVTSVTQYDALSDTNVMVLHLRMGVKYRSTDAAAVTYNLTV